MSVEEYSWAKVDITLMGRLLINVDDFEYKRTQEIEVFHGNGQEPTGWGRGEIKGEGKVTVSGAEYASIIDFAAAYGYDILKLPPFPIIATQKAEDMPTIVHVLTQCVFKEDGFKGKAKDKRFLVDLPFVIVGEVQKVKI